MHPKLDISKANILFIYFGHTLLELIFSPGTVKRTFLELVSNILKPIKDVSDIHKLFMNILQGRAPHRFSERIARLFFAQN